MTLAKLSASPLNTQISSVTATAKSNGTSVSSTSVMNGVPPSFSSAGKTHD
jgi:hypothetical protein